MLIVVRSQWLNFRADRTVKFFLFATRGRARSCALAYPEGRLGEFKLPPHWIFRYFLNCVFAKYAV